MKHKRLDKTAPKCVKELVFSSLFWYEYKTSRANNFKTRILNAKRIKLRNNENRCNQILATSKVYSGRWHHIWNRLGLTCYMACIIWTVLQSADKTFAKCSAKNENKLYWCDNLEMFICRKKHVLFYVKFVSLV